VKKIGEILNDKEIERLIDWELHPFDAVTRYLEWGTNWSRGLNHAKSCNEESAYFKINAMSNPARLMLVRQSHKNYEIVSEVEAPQVMSVVNSGHQIVQATACCSWNSLSKAAGDK
jgi:hypothetical protein